MHTEVTETNSGTQLVIHFALSGSDLAIMSDNQMQILFDGLSLLLGAQYTPQEEIATDEA